MILLPKKYLSYSQFVLAEKSINEYEKRYIWGEKGPDNIYTALGKKVAENREKSGKTGDSESDHVAHFMPEYPKREQKITAQLKINGGKIVILGKPDGADNRKRIIADDKTGKRWTQKMADKSDQLTWYTYIKYLNTGKFYTCRIHWAETKEKDEEIKLTGRLETFETARDFKDFMSLHQRIVIITKKIDALMREKLEKI